MKNLVIIVFLFLLFIVFTASNPTAQQPWDVDDKTYPENYDEIIKNYIAYRLIDPESASYNFKSMPEEGCLRTFTSVNCGYVVVVDINEKNQTGGHSDWQNHTFLIRDGKVIDMQ